MAAVLPSVLCRARRYAASIASFTVAPPPAALDAARGTVPSPAGTISVTWRHGAHGAFSLDLTVPPNTAATVRLPATRVSIISEDGHPLRSAACVHVLGSSGGAAVLHVDAGTYHFAVAR